MTNESQTTAKEVPKTAPEAPAAKTAPSQQGGASNGVAPPSASARESAESAESAKTEKAQDRENREHRENRSGPRAGKSQRTRGENAMQDRFLARLRRTHATVAVRLSGSAEVLEGQVVGFDHFCLLLATAKGEALVYKHGVACFLTLSEGAHPDRVREPSGKKSRGGKPANDKRNHHRRDNRHDNRHNNRHSAAAHKPATASLREMLAETATKEESVKGHNPPAETAPTGHYSPAGAEDGAEKNAKSAKGEAAKDGGSTP